MIATLETHLTGDVVALPDINMDTGACFFVAAICQPGFDSFVLRPSIAGNILFLVENKFSEGNLNLSRGEIWNKFDILTEGGILGAMTAKYDVRPEHVVVVFAAMRGLPTRFDRGNARQSILQDYKRMDEKRARGRAATEAFRGEIVILDRDGLRKFYGPTFGNYGLFALKKFSSASSGEKIV